jgi:DNA-binding transcriptional MerR regulator
MRISALSQLTGVSTATIHFYIREGLVPPGEATGRNQADYGQAHVERLQLIRALIEVGGVSLAAVRRVVAAIETPGRTTHDMLGEATRALEGMTPAVSGESLAEVDNLVRSLGWTVKPDSPARSQVAAALAALRSFDPDAPVDVLMPYAVLADRLAGTEVAAITGDASPAVIVERAVLGTVVFEAALIALRRMALEHHSASTFDRAG